jgi:hypothetical protein
VAARGGLCASFAALSLLPALVVPGVDAVDEMRRCGQRLVEPQSAGRLVQPGGEVSPTSAERWQGGANTTAAYVTRKREAFGRAEEFRHGGSG